MRLVYPARLRCTGPDEIVVSFRDLPECLTAGGDETEALAEAADAKAVTRQRRATRYQPSLVRRPCFCSSSAIASLVRSNTEKPSAISPHIRLPAACSFALILA